MPPYSWNCVKKLVKRLGRLHHGHQQLDGAGAVHLFADDGFDLADDAQAQRHPGVEPAAEFLDQAGAQHQLVAEELRFAGGKSTAS